MTFYEFGIKDLVSKGMFDIQATEVMNRVVIDSKNKDSANNAMNGRWDDKVEDYPPTMSVVLSIAIEPIALEWIKDTLPEAWFRPMFDKDHPVRKQFEENKKGDK